MCLHIVCHLLTKNKKAIKNSLLRESLGVKVHVHHLPGENRGKKYDKLSSNIVYMLKSSSIISLLNYYKRIYTSLTYFYYMLYLYDFGIVPKLSIVLFV